MLSQKFVERCKRPGRYRDSVIAGLLLQITDSGAKSWILRYQLNHREHMLGLGSAATFTLKEARERGRAARQLLADRIDPVQSKHSAKQAAKLAEQRKLTFAEAAQKYFDQNADKWRNTKHRQQFLGSLRAIAFPTIGGMDVAAIDTAAVLRVLDVIWNTKSITADRVRSRIEAVIDWAVVRGHRLPGTNPAAWKNHLDQVLPAPRKVAPVVHHKAMPYTEVPAFMVELREQQSSAARALEYLIYTAARSGEVLGATWSEIDFDNKMWVVPGNRMKSGREHRQPLSDAALDLLRKLPREAGNPHVFIGDRTGSGLTAMALWLLMERMGKRGIATVHGFRSAFSDWAHEQTAHSAHTIEISLAHSVGPATERAYRRGPMLAKRVKLMNDWAKYCATPARAKAGGNVVAINERRR
jgi:integrase